MSSEVRLERVGSSGKKRWAAVAAILAGILVLLWLKPWGSPPAEMAVSTNRPTATAAASGIAGDPFVSEGSSLRPLCQASNEWQLVTLDAAGGVTLRSVMPGFPQVASSPTDPGLELDEISPTNLRAVGVCVPRSPVVSPTSQLLKVVLWEVTTAGIAREIERPTLLYPDLYDIGEAYYAPPEGEGQFWPAGKYVFEIRLIEGPASHWMGVESAPRSPGQATLDD